MYSVSLAISVFLVLHAYLARKVERTGLNYVPAYWLFILGLVINISRQLSVVPQSMSRLALVVGGLFMIIVVVLMERQRRKIKKNKPLHE